MDALILAGTPGNEESLLKASRYVIKDSANCFLRNADVTFDVGGNRVEVHARI